MVLSLRERLIELWNPEDPLDSLWRILASRSATAWLCASLAVLVTIVVFVPQRPAEALADPLANSRWLESLSVRFGNTANWLTSLRLVDVGQSTLLRVLLGLLALNLLLGLVDLLHPMHQASGALPALRAQEDGGVRPRLGRVSRARLLATSSQAEGPPELTASVAQALKAQGYRLAHSADADWLYADRYVAFGTMLLLGLLLAVAGVVLSERTAWWEDNVSLGPGQVRPLGHGTDLALQADVVEVQSDGQMDSASETSFRTRVTLLREGEAIATGQLPDRFPALYDGLAFYATSTEPALLIQAEDSSGTSVPLQTPETGTTQFTQVVLRFREQEAEESPQYIVVLDLTHGRQVGRQFEQRANERYVIVPSRNLSLRLVHEPTSTQTTRYRLEVYRGNDASPSEAHTLEAASSLEIDGDLYSFRPQRHAVIRFGQDYGLGVVLIGAVVALVGLGLGALRRRRRVWVWPEPAEEKAILNLATVGQAVPWFEALLTDIAARTQLKVLDAGTSD